MKKQRLLLFMMLCFLLFGLCSCSKKSEGEKMRVEGIDDLPGTKIGVQIGTTGDTYAQDYEGG